MRDGLNRIEGRERDRGLRLAGEERRTPKRNRERSTDITQAQVQDVPT